MYVKVILSNKYLDLFNSHENLHVCSFIIEKPNKDRTGDLVKREGDRRERRRTVAVGYGETFRLYPPETEVAFKDYRSLA